MKPTKFDFFLISALLAVAILSGVAMLFLHPVWEPAGEDLVATVEIKGKLVAILPLAEDTALALPTGHTVEVKNGAVTVTSAPCQDQICRKTPAASRAGDTIICLPEKLIITIREEGST